MAKKRSPPSPGPEQQLAEYRRKRDFSKTGEPEGGRARDAKKLQFDPSVKRLAMQVEDHPIEYNAFEGTIPQGEYGGGTVMLWDRGTYSYGGTDPEPAEGLRRGYEKGDFKFVLNGKRLKGSWALMSTRCRAPMSPPTFKPRWQRDEQWTRSPRARAGSGAPTGWSNRLRQDRSARSSRPTGA